MINMKFLLLLFFVCLRHYVYNLIKQYNLN